MAYDAAAGTVVLFGGGVWRWDGHDWTALALPAVDRANAAWAAAQKSLDPNDLAMGVTGQALTDDTTQIGQLRSAGQSRKDVNAAFTVLDVTLVSDTEATVHTTEARSDEVDNARTGAFIRADPATTYSETDTLDLVGDQWIVSNYCCAIGAQAGCRELGLQPGSRRRRRSRYAKPRVWQERT